MLCICCGGCVFIVHTWIVPNGTLGIFVLIVASCLWTAGSWTDAEKVRVCVGVWESQSSFSVLEFTLFLASFCNVLRKYSTLSSNVLVSATSWDGGREITCKPKSCVFEDLSFCIFWITSWPYMPWRVGLPGQRKGNSGFEVGPKWDKDTSIPPGELSQAHHAPVRWAATLLPLFPP